MTDGQSSSRHIPEPMRRAVMVEAGHRCAIPTCRMTSALEVHHIVDWAEVRKHEFENLICLCAVCHSRAGRGDIDRLAMKRYKANLSLLTSRYGEFERRLLEDWARSDAGPGAVKVLTGGLELLFSELARDGLVKVTHSSTMTATNVGGPLETVDGPDGKPIVVLEPQAIPIQSALTLTEAGAVVVQDLRDGRRLQ